MNILKTMTETITLIVKVKINYPDKKSRKEAIKMAKRCVSSASILGMTGSVTKSAKLLK